MEHTRKQRQRQGGLNVLPVSRENSKTFTVIANEKAAVAAATQSQPIGQKEVRGNYSNEIV